MSQRCCIHSIRYLSGFWNYVWLTSAFPPGIWRLSVWCHVYSYLHPKRLIDFINSFYVFIFSEYLGIFFFLLTAQYSGVAAYKGKKINFVKITYKPQTNIITSSSLQIYRFQSYRWENAKSKRLLKSHNFFKSGLLISSIFYWNEQDITETLCKITSKQKELSKYTNLDYRHY